MLMEKIDEITDLKPKMWGKSVVGYGKTVYSKLTLKNQPCVLLGFSPRKNALTLYVSAYSDYIYELTDKQGFKHGKGCVYIKDFSFYCFLPIKHIKTTINRSYFPDLCTDSYYCVDIIKFNLI